MAREKTSPGLKILWVWTIGTAAILVTNVMRTRLRDMEKVMSAQQQQQEGVTPDSVILDTSPESNEGIVREVK
ncbi:hypothetical protein F383_23715 [Gossypium arboreum]|uniref:Uncharacterized protein n=12 Tax=Gossypium TaxID=3633 RepID=A0A2P5PWS5_GOSBA|nr:uncharacterized protein LOC105780902 [Gossypium raimondii]XP_016750948.1 uncharacterized protein LOC107959402 [Gossypium hirsutum]KAB2033556.1 hypothetical protein ES319_D04G025800v1 [Gossypium barbadense]KHG16729.1 hypothetical protein F383_23715 [Gossypium arboreum]MBA0814174.1 hypothetical protein [Gossypium harknessii]MBA0841896.1 hypothetical protein [Gossypium armourianum]MBA0878634.1 hypothetical protein [Gossypium schwendimanii]TYG72519.1 hypothetical protein ES288_D04G027300v1 [G